jgi:hypothetical protein
MIIEIDRIGDHAFPGAVGWKRANLIRKESADVVIVIESLERKKTCLSSLQIARCRRSRRRR